MLIDVRTYVYIHIHMSIYTYIGVLNSLEKNDLSYVYIHVRDYYA
jgi:hypothetical protein